LHSDRHSCIAPLGFDCSSGEICAAGLVCDESQICKRPLGATCSVDGECSAGLY
jgi:hypothetical protein